MATSDKPPSMSIPPTPSIQYQSQQNDTQLFGLGIQMLIFLLTWSLFPGNSIFGHNKNNKLIPFSLASSASLIGSFLCASFSTEPIQQFNWKNSFYCIGFMLVFVVFLLPLVSRFVFGRGRCRCVLLVGLSDSGKTALFMRLVANRLCNTVTSLKESQSTLLLPQPFNKKSTEQSKNNGIMIVDLPGNDRLRAKYWEQYRSQASLLVFVLDTTTLRVRLREVCDFLYLILADQVVQSNHVPIVIACNKSDTDGALDSDIVEKLLTRELNAIRDTHKQGQQLIKTSNNDSNDDKSSTIGTFGKDDFEFSDLKESTPITFINCNISDVEKLRSTIMLSY